jgi:hypothetical protein
LGCNSDELDPPDCRTDVAVLIGTDYCEEEQHRRGVEPLSGHGVSVPREAMRLISGDQRIDGSWAAGRLACAPFAEVEPYRVPFAPMVDGVCLLACVGETQGVRNGACVVAAVEAVSGRELWRVEVASRGLLESRGSRIFLRQPPTAEARSHFISSLDVRTGDVLWTQEIAESTLGILGDVLFTTRTLKNSGCDPY